VRWFQHETDAHEHPKVKQLIKEFGADGYMVCFVTFEIIGKYGDKYLRLSLEKFPKTDLADVLKIKEDKVEMIWQFMAKKSLLSPKHLREGVLYSSKLKERADNYYKKGRMPYVRQTSDGRDTRQYNTRQDNTKKKILSDEDFLETLKVNSAYKHIDINIELAKMDAWLLAHKGRQKTRRFIVNWLNKIDRPITINKPEIKLERPEPINEEERKKVSRLIHETAIKLKRER
jgi:hypothetical protein